MSGTSSGPYWGRLPEKGWKHLCFSPPTEQIFVDFYNLLTKNALYHIFIHITDPNHIIWFIVNCWLESLEFVISLPKYQRSYQALEGLNCLKEKISNLPFKISPLLVCFVSRSSQFRAQLRKQLWHYGGKKKERKTSVGFLESKQCSIFNHTGKHIWWQTLRSNTRKNQYVCSTQIEWL